MCYGIQLLRNVCFYHLLDMGLQEASDRLWAQLAHLRNGDDTCTHGKVGKGVTSGLPLSPSTTAGTHCILMLLSIIVLGYTFVIGELRALWESLMGTEDGDGREWGQLRETSVEEMAGLNTDARVTVTRKTWMGSPYRRTNMPQSPELVTSTECPKISSITEGNKEEGRQ